MILPEGNWSNNQPSGVTPTTCARRSPAGDRGIDLSDSEMRSRGCSFFSAFRFGFAGDSGFLADDFSDTVGSGSEVVVSGAAFFGPSSGGAVSGGLACGSSSA